MPIRIREVHIKATVADEKTAAEREEGASTISASGKKDVQEIVDMCVAQVMRRLRKMEER